MKKRLEILRRLVELEEQMEEQTKNILASKKGYGGPESLFCDERCIERKTLSWVLNMEHEPFNNADCMAGW